VSVACVLQGMKPQRTANAMNLKQPCHLRNFMQHVICPVQGLRIAREAAWWFDQEEAAH